MYIQRMSKERDAIYTIRMNETDRATLDAVAEHEDLSRADIVRRSVRHYAAHLGVKIPRRKSAKK